MPEEKKSNKERLKEITDSIEAGIKELFESEKYQQYLQTMSRFHRYSVNNTMLIYMQKPDATLVAGFNKWRDQFERNVNKGERSLRPPLTKRRLRNRSWTPTPGSPCWMRMGRSSWRKKKSRSPCISLLRCSM